ncbi:hypothetical protein [Prosthecomicrobium hirschii]|nr:hypothetical protein [Prosthecomicrobium hirschii]
MKLDRNDIEGLRATGIPQFMALADALEAGADEAALAELARSFGLIRSAWSWPDR